MGSYARPTNRDETPSSETEDGSQRLGDILSGRLSDIDIDSIEAVRDEREPE